MIVRIAAAIEKASYDECGQHEQSDRYSRESPYRSLIHAMLEDVFRVSHQRTHAARKQAEIDRAWLLSGDTDAFSILWCCQHLEVDPDTVRHAYFAAPLFWNR